MPVAEWYLKTYETSQDGTKIVIDPAAVAGLKGTFGQALFFPYSISEKETGRVSLRLLSLEGGIGWSGEADYVAKLLIPSQVVRSDGRQLGLQVPITDIQIKAIEEARKGDRVIFTISFSGLAFVTPLASAQEAVPNQRGYTPPQPGLTPVQSSYPAQFVIEREHWLTILQQLGAGTRRLVELPISHLPQGEQCWAECIRLLQEATQLYRRGAYEHALVNCRQIAEGIPQVLCAVWSLPKQKDGQSLEGWFKEIDNRLSAAWLEDKVTPGMLRTMIVGTWHWLAPTPHYGTNIPLREDVTFALGLCTDLLSFAAQVLLAHPNPISQQHFIQDDR